MACALLPNSTVLYRIPKFCRSRPRSSLRPTSAQGKPFNAVSWSVDQTLKTLRPRVAQRCSAGMTASHENTQTQASDPSGTQRTVTEEMFSRAERYASAAGPGTLTTLDDCHCMQFDPIVLAATCDKPVQFAAGGAGGNPTYAALQGADAAWAKIKGQQVPVLASVRANLVHWLLISNGIQPAPAV